METAIQTVLSFGSPAFWGGMIACASTSLGAGMSHFWKPQGAKERFSATIDFALGLMISASAFSLIGPVAMQSFSNPHAFHNVLGATATGMILIFVLKKRIDSMQTPGRSLKRTSHILLASALMFHNFPEGVASGAALSGLEFSASFPIVGGIALQNVPEGALMVICLKALGWRNSTALLGGIASGVMELGGGVVAGMLLSSINGVLPLVLSFAGGAMLGSVLLELLEERRLAPKPIWSRRFAAGFFCLPLLQMILNRLPGM